MARCGRRGAVGESALAGHADDRRLRERRTRNGAILAGAAGSELGGTETIADGIEVQSPYPEAVADLVGLADDILLVEDHALIAAMQQAHRELGVALEPAGAAGLAALTIYASVQRDN